MSNEPGPKITVTIVESTLRRMTLPAAQWARLCQVRGTPIEVARWIRDGQPTMVESLLLDQSPRSDAGVDDEWTVYLDDQEVND